MEGFFFLRLPKILLRIKIYLHLQSSGELQRSIGLLFMFVLLGLSGAKKSIASIF